MDLQNREGLSSAFREEIIEVYNQGFCANKMLVSSIDLKTTVWGLVDKIVYHHWYFGTILPLSRSKAHHGTIFAREIQVKLFFIDPINIHGGQRAAKQR